MIPVAQTPTKVEEEGDCVAAAIASLLEVPLEHVPAATPAELADHAKGWPAYLERLRKFTILERGLDVWCVDLGFGKEGRPLDEIEEGVIPSGLWIAAISTDTNAKDGSMLGHALVCRGREVVHDPAGWKGDEPDCPEFRKSPRLHSIYLLLPINPASVE